MSSYDSEIPKEQVQDLFEREAKAKEEEKLAPYRAWLEYRDAKEISPQTTGRGIGFFNGTSSMFFSPAKNINTACALCLSAFSIIEDIIMQADADEAKARELHTKMPAVTLPLPFSLRRLALPARAKNKETYGRYIGLL